MKKLYTKDEIETLLFEYAEEHALLSCKQDIEIFNEWIQENIE